MTKCDDCNLEMNEADSCTLTHMTMNIDNKKYEREQYDADYDEPNRCHDCNVKPGGFHHLGCDVERCARCNGQLITCECWCDCDCHKGNTDLIKDGECSYCGGHEIWDKE